MRRFELLLGTALLFVMALFGSRLMRVAGSGHSMEPGLRDGDWLIVDRRGRANIGDVVVAVDPRENGRVIIKRLATVGSDSQLTIASDHPAHAEEEIGPVAASAVVGRAVLIYWPPRRVGYVH